MSAATRSEPECSASEMMAMDPERMPTVSLKTMRIALDAIETAAARDLSAWLSWSATTTFGSVGVALLAMK